jgi:hypothetical protein
MDNNQNLENFLSDFFNSNDKKEENVVISYTREAFEQEIKSKFEDESVNKELEITVDKLFGDVINIFILGYRVII